MALVFSPIRRAEPCRDCAVPVQWWFAAAVCRRTRPRRCPAVRTVRNEWTGQNELDAAYRGARGPGRLAHLLHAGLGQRTLAVVGPTSPFGFSHSMSNQIELHHDGDCRSARAELRLGRTRVGRRVPWLRGVFATPASPARQAGHPPRRKNRASSEQTKTMVTSTSAPAQAWRCQSS